MNFLTILLDGARQLFFRTPAFPHKVKSLIGIFSIMVSMAVSAAVLGEYYIACFIFYWLEEIIEFSEVASHLITASILLLQSTLFFWLCSLSMRKNHDDLLLKKLLMAFINGLYNK